MYFQPSLTYLDSTHRRFNLGISCINLRVSLVDTRFLFFHTLDDLL